MSDSCLPVPAVPQGAAAEPGRETIDALVDAFAAALRDKLHAAEKKYGWNGAWQRSEPQALRDDLRRHLEKGDPRDVAAFCAFLWRRGERTDSSADEPAPADALIEAVREAAGEYAEAEADHASSWAVSASSTRKAVSRAHDKLEFALAALRQSLASAAARAHSLTEKADAYDRINTPEIDDFLSAVKNEALHQRERWGVDQDGGKQAADWFWLVGYLAGKALHDVKGKRLHHIITAGAALLNWHAHAVGAYAGMRPGIADPDAALSPSPSEPAR